VPSISIKLQSPPPDIPPGRQANPSTESVNERSGYGRIPILLMDGAKRLLAAQRSRDADGVELAACMGLEVLEGRLERPGLLVGTLAGECVEHIRHRDDASLQRDRLPCQPLRI